MTWAPLLLADPSPCLRWLALRTLWNIPADHPEARELEAARLQDPLVSGLLTRQKPDGSWDTLGYPGLGEGAILKNTAMALARLGYLGFDVNFPSVQRGAEYLYAQQADDGSWPLLEQPDHEGEDTGYDMIPLQTALPLRGLAACGYACDPRSELAYEWLLAQRLPDGAWPTGKSAGVFGYVAGYRRLAHSRWGCRSNTTGALICLSLHPQRRSSHEAQHALDILLARETRDRQPLGFEVARLLGAEPVRGLFTFFARFDLALIADLCSRLGVGTEDPRVTNLVDFLHRQQGEFGLWEYLPRPQVSRWLTFDLLKSLTNLNAQTGWIGIEPSTPFQAYPRKQRKY